MSSIVLAVGNGKTLFGGAGVAPDADLVRFVDPESPIINAFDLCALRGDGIFEATTVWKGFPVSLENHLKRLANSARLVDMPEPNIPALTRAVQLVIDQYDDPEPGPMLRIIVSRGLDPDTGVGKAADRTPTVYIFLDAKGTLHSLEPITMASMTRGYPSDITARAPWLLNGAKTLSYAFNCAVHRECARRGVGDAILFTEDGYTMECPNSSIVARYGDTFVTPDPRIGILNGTSQRENVRLGARRGQEGGVQEAADRRAARSGQPVHDARRMVDSDQRDRRARTCRGCGGDPGDQRCDPFGPHARGRVEDRSDRRLRIRRNDPLSR